MRTSSMRLPAVPAGKRRARGSALLAVLWLSAALAAIAFSLANTVRGEIDRAGTAVDGLRTYYLAAGGLNRAALELLWAVEKGGYTRSPLAITVLPLSFPTGEVQVEIIPETSKLNINYARPEDLYRLLAALGIDDGRAREIVMAIVDWRSPAPAGGLSEFDAYYMSIAPTFRARHASLQEIEELLLVRGMTPDIYYGTWLPSADMSGRGPRLVRRTGLAECVSVFGTTDRVDANTALAPVLAAVGVPPDVIAALLQRRRTAPFQTPQELNDFLGNTGPGNRLRLGGNTIFTLRSTARLRLPGGQLSDLRRTVAAQVKFMPGAYDSPVHYLRWYDTAWSN